MRVLRSRKWRAALVTLALVTVSVGVPAWRYWRDINRYLAYQRQQQQFRNGNDPLLRGLATREYGPGYPIEDLIRMFPHKQVYRHDEFVTVMFGEPDALGGPQVIAKDGRVVYALDGWCSHAHLFFDTMTPAEWHRYHQSLSIVFSEEREKRYAPSHAVAGVAGLAFNMGYYATPENP